MRAFLFASASVAALAIAAPANAGTWVAITPVANSATFAAFGINGSNTITGDWTDSNGAQHGFVGPVDGSNYTTFDDTDGTTQPRGINNKGWIAGFDSGTTNTWERSPTGTLSGVTKKGVQLTGVAQGLNSSNLFAADYIDPNTGATVPYLGQKYKFQSKVALSLTNAGAAARAIDTAGDIAGWFYDVSTGLQHGFLIIAGTATQIDVPTATYTVMEGINNKGIASGQFADSGGTIHGFYYVIGTGKIKQLDAPSASNTQVWGLNDKGVVLASVPGAGSYVYCIHALKCPIAPEASVHSSTKAAARPELP